MSVVSDNKVLKLICPFCHADLDCQNEYLRCYTCKNEYPFINSIPSFIAESEQGTIQFYEAWYKEPHRIYNIEGIGQPIKTTSFIKKYSIIFEKILYTQFRRERFFKKVSAKFSNSHQHINVLDLGCGGGNAQFLSFGNVYGVDYCAASMKHGVAGKDYKMLVNCNAVMLPFESEQFDCIVSSDFVGHVSHEEKERLFVEMSRVLKRNGICAHVIETDSENFVKRFAKKYPDLYRKYFVEGIGGHFGLELPTDALNRFRAVGLEPVHVEKYYSYIWDIESFIALFDNEYRGKSFLLEIIISFYRLLCKKFLIKVIATSVIGLFSYIIDTVTPINKAEGIMVVCVKRNRSESEI